MNITGTTFTGCTLGPYVDLNVFSGTANNQIGLLYSPVVSLYSGINNTVGLSITVVNSLYSEVNNQIGITARGA